MLGFKKIKYIKNGKRNIMESKFFIFGLLKN